MSEEKNACCSCECHAIEERKSLNRKDRKNQNKQNNLLNPNKLNHLHKLNELNKEEILRYSDMEIFRGIEKENLNALLYCMKSYLRSYKKGELIHLEENHEKHVGVVLFGSIHMIKTDVWGRETLLTYMGEGEIFGETFGNSASEDEYVSFLSVAKTEVLFLSFEKAIHVCKNQCSFHFRLIENLFDLISKKNIQLMEKIEVTSRSSLREKILAYLSLQAQKQRSKYIELSLSRTDMAQFLCTNRSAMTRELSALKEEGIIDFDRNTFILKTQKEI